MLPLDKEYSARLQKIAEAIQASEELVKYLEEEEEEDYLALRESYEPLINEVHAEVAAKNPLQLIAAEEAIFDASFEGLYLPRILGYAVLRGEVDEQFIYRRPQSHFQNALMAICNSANFDILKKRIGQTIQVGFALSSDIWITNLINNFDNRKIRYFLQSQKLDKYRNLVDRRMGYLRYKRQFDSENYMTAIFPENAGQLPIYFSRLKTFLAYRATLEGADNSSIVPHVKAFVNNKALWGTKEHMQILGIYGGYWELEDWMKKDGKAAMTNCRENLDEFDEHWFGFLLELFSGSMAPNAQTDQQWSVLTDRAVKDEMADYFDLVTKVHETEIEAEATQEAIREFHRQRPGLSKVNECVRKTIYQYFQRAIQPLTATQYTRFFEVTRLYPVYMEIFANQQFNQDLKELSMSFIKKCLKLFVDKRGKDYQDIKKFVSTTFVDLGFLTDKQTVELFKTRRKRKPGE
ncbi:MAG: hypothetical protein KDC34_13415 [Saprospiraceae bacterium]|nr:hypothetical protein [Saprospiraceae bacterium]